MSVWSPWNGPDGTPNWVRYAAAKLLGLNRCRQSIRSQAPRACPCRQQDRGKCRELLAIELPELAELLVLEGLDIAITGTEKLSVLRRRKRWLITVWLEVRILPAPPRTPIRTGVSWSLTNSPQFAGVSAVQIPGVRSLPPVEGAIAPIVAPSLWALQTRSWRRPGCT
jgi:hypothetical protein